MLTINLQFNCNTTLFFVQYHKTTNFAFLLIQAYK